MIEDRISTRWRIQCKRKWISFQNDAGKDFFRLVQTMTEHLRCRECPQPDSVNCTKCFSVNDFKDFPEGKLMQYICKVQEPDEATYYCCIFKYPKLVEYLRTYKWK